MDAIRLMRAYSYQPASTATLFCVMAGLDPAIRFGKIRPTPYRFQADARIKVRA
jgi:hypothetical protein